jgi:hypothetical protein
MTMPTTGNRSGRKTTEGTGMGTVIARTAMENRKTPGKKINWKPFFDLAELFNNGVISREHLILNWGLAQRDQGIKAERR